jgi:hypothetical protein
MPGLIRNQSEWLAEKGDDIAPMGDGALSLRPRRNYFPISPIDHRRSLNNSDTDHLRPCVPDKEKRHGQERFQTKPN